MDKVIIDIGSIVFGYVGLLCAIKKTDQRDSKTMFGMNVYKYKSDLYDGYLNNNGLIFTGVIFLIQLLERIFEGVLLDRLYSNCIYVLIALVFSIIAYLIYKLVSLISSVSAKKAFINRKFPEMFTALDNVLNRVRENDYKNDKDHNVIDDIYYLESFLFVKTSRENIQKKIMIFEKTLSKYKSKYSENEN